MLEKWSGPPLVFDGKQYQDSVCVLASVYWIGFACLQSKIEHFCGATHGAHIKTYLDEVINVFDIV
jgi:hypothetical protein